MFFRRAFKNGKLRYMFEIAGQTSTCYKRFVVLLFCQSICLDHHIWCTTQLALLSLFPWSPPSSEKKTTVPQKEESHCVTLDSGGEDHERTETPTAAAGNWAYIRVFAVLRKIKNMAHDTSGNKKDPGPKSRIVQANYLSSADVSPEKDATRTECYSRLCIESLLLRTRCFKTWLATNTRKH